MVLGDVQVVADPLEDEDGLELGLECQGLVLAAMLNQVFQHIGRSVGTIGRPLVLVRLNIHGQTLEVCLMAVITPFWVCYPCRSLCTHP